jgi:hypothetical protein
LLYRYLKTLFLGEELDEPEDELDGADAELWR